MDEETNNNDHLEENVSQESDVNTESTKNTEETTDFNPDAFTSVPPVKNTTEQNTEGNEAQEDTSNKNGTTEETTVENTNDDFTWDDYISNKNESNTQESTQESNEETSTETSSTNNVSDDNNAQTETTSSNEDSQVQTEQQSSLNDAYKKVADELGLEAQSLDDLKKTLEDIQKENEELREAKLSGVTNESVQKLESYKSKSDEDLVRLELKKQGFNDEEINRAVDRYIDNDALWIEAKKIRNTIDNAIKREQETVLDTQKNAQAMQEKERVEAVESLTKYINEQDTMFGLKMAKDDESLKSVRNEHVNYITSGDFWGDITKNNENLSQAAWLWKNKDVILKALGGREFNKGRQEILNDIGNPDIPGTTRHKDPGGSDEFNPQKFVYGD